MRLDDLFAVVFATGAIIEVWEKGSIFATQRAYVQALQDSTDPATAKGLLLELLTCPFCKSYHIPIYLFAIIAISDALSPGLAFCVRLVTYGLAATRLSNIVNSLLPPHARYSPPIEEDYVDPTTP
jgi:hypothetical protein